MKGVLQMRVTQSTSSNTAPRPLGITRPPVRTRANVDGSWIRQRKAQ